MATCDLCGKVVRTTQALAGHYRFAHQQERRGAKQGRLLGSRTLVTQDEVQELRGRQERMEQQLKREFLLSVVEAWWETEGSSLMAAWWLREGRQTLEPLLRLLLQQRLERLEQPKPSV